MSIRLRWDSARRWDDAFRWTGDEFAYPPRGEIVVLVEVERAAGNLLFSSGRWVDQDAALIAQPRIGSEVRFQRRASLPFWGSGRSVFGLGSVELINADGGLDWMPFDSSLRGSVVTVWLGPDNVPLAAMRKVARAIVDRVETVGEASVRLVLLDAGAELDAPILDKTFSGGPLAGKLRPAAFGRCLSVPVLQSGSPSLRYSVHDTAGAAAAGGLSAIVEVQDQGATLTPGTGWTSYQVGDTVGFELLAAPAGRITATVHGPSSDPSGTEPAKIDHVFDALLRIRRGWSASRIDLAGLEALSSETGAQLGRYVDSGATFSQVATELTDSVSAFWWIDTDGIFRVRRWRVPSGEPVLEIGDAERAGELQVEPDTAPGLANAVLASRNWHAHAPGELALSVRDTAAGVALQQAYRAAYPFAVADFYANARGAQGADRTDSASSTGSANRPAADQGMPSLLIDGTEEAAHRASLYGEAKSFYRLDAVLGAVEAASLTPGDVVRLSSARYGLASGLLLSVLSVEGVLGEGLVSLVLWGGSSPLSAS